MPKDQASWDRKEIFFRQRKHDKSEPSFDSAIRWRDSPSREFSRLGSGDFRRPCHGKQDGRYQLGEETSHGYTSSRSSSRVFENEYYRPSTSRGDLRYTRNCRDDRVPFSQKDWKCNTWEMSNGSSRGFERPCGLRNGSRSVDERPPNASDTYTTVVNSSDPANSAHQPDIELCTTVRTLKFKNEHKFSDQKLSLSSYPLSDSVSLSERPSLENIYGNKAFSPAKQCNELMYGQRLHNDNSLDHPTVSAELEGTWEQLHPKDPQDNRLNGINNLDDARKNGKEISLGAVGKLPVWTCSGSFASQNSCFSHSSSSKCLGGADSSDRKSEYLPKTVVATQSSSGDATACATTTHLSEELSSRKKQRLGWGEGLAKYEKKKVDVNEDGTTLLENDTEELQSFNQSIADKSPTTAIVSDYGSPTTPSGVACSSSPDKSSVKAEIAVSDVSNICRSPSPVATIHFEPFPINIEEFDHVSVERFGCLLNELLGTNDPGTGDSSSAQVAVNRLLACKGDILKAVEMTESEIDLLENKHRKLKLESGRHCCVVGPGSYLCEEDEHVPKEQEGSCILSPKTAASPVVETLLRNPVHEAVLAEVSIDVLKDRSGEAKSLSQSSGTVGCNDDWLPTPSIKAAASSKEINTTAFVSHETIELSFADDSMASSEDLLCAKLLSSNKNCASESSQVLNEILPRDFSFFDGSRFLDVCQKQFDSHVKEKIADKVQLLRVREKILLLQFKAFQLSWKKDLHQLALTKELSKSNQKTELYPSVKNSGHLKLPRPIRLRFSSAAPRRDDVAPTEELVSHMEKLLPCTRLKPFRDILKMPAMILDEKEKVMSTFISSNGLIEDPCEVEKERTMINPWTLEEKETFLNMLAMHGKDFKKIASFLTQKTTADCIEYYYKNHKSDCFGIIKKQRAYGIEGRHTFMLGPRKNWKHNLGSASLDILGDISIMAANTGKIASTRKISSKGFTLSGCNRSNSLQPNGNDSEGCSYSFHFPRKRTVGGDLLAVGSFSSEQISACLKTSLNSRERCRDLPEFDHVVKKPRISHTTHNEDSNEGDDSCSEESSGETGSIHWTDDERSAFIQGFSIFGKNFAAISRFVSTRSQDQCKVFYSKVRKCLGLECVQSGSGNGSTYASVDIANECGGSDLEDPCAMESNSGICNNGVRAKMDLNSPTSPFNLNQEEANHSGSVNVKAGLSKSEQKNGLILLHLKDGSNHSNNAYVNGGFPGLVSEPCRDLVDINAVESQCQAAGKSKSNDLLSVEVDEGNLTSIYVSSDHLYCGLSILSNIVVETPTETSHNGSGGEGAAFPKQSSKSCRIRQRSLKQDPSRISRSKSDLNVKAQGTCEGFSLNKCTSSATKPLTVYHKDGGSGHKRSHSFSFCDIERLDKNGEVKLFGTVLTADENGSKQKHNPGGSIRSSTLSKDHDTSHHHQYINQQHLQNVPITSSYGYWDGSRIQTGLTSLPESAKLFASCPEEFTAHIKQQFLSSQETQSGFHGGVKIFTKHIQDREEASRSKDEGNIGVDGVAEAVT